MASSSRQSLVSSATSSSATSQEGKRKVFVVDDHPIFHRGIRDTLKLQPDLEICGEAMDANQALGELATARPDLVMVDINLPGMGGLELIKELRGKYPELRLLAISSHDEQVYALPALRAGAGGYVMKHAELPELLDAIRRVLEGQTWVSPEFSGQLIYRVARSADGHAPSPLEVLTTREREVLDYVGQGMSSQEIAELLKVSIKTVESHRLHVKEKLQIKNAAELIRFAVEWKNAQKLTESSTAE